MADLVHVSDVYSLRNYLIDNGVDVAQLFVVLGNFAKGLDFTTDDANLYQKFFLQNAIEQICMEIDPKK